ncbi:hypothetical protein [Candidatus Reidiella endopervernicosa]|uniref:Uncharacterized protein n=1 Tax=Candidatus Reidiella endopervernicosa TaxID=2738883 RepID=A0A6N0HZ02_9GAMM|nr:hypothetical protein [Candidatus Reidiella endopervernicosa]QKQ27610.1 hypothetical protein HUE57_15920 [Candidatus Reidiella endopervernicosa]
MCLALPRDGKSGLSGKPPGPIKLFFGGLAFIAVLLFAMLSSAWRGSGS